MRGSGKRLRALLPRCAAAAITALVWSILLAPSAFAEDEPLLEGDLPAWIPSIGFGFGVQSREIEGTLGAGDLSFTGIFDPNLQVLNTISKAYVKTDTVQSAQAPPPKLLCVQPVEFRTLPPPRDGFCVFDSQKSRALDGGTLPLSLQLLGPPAELPGRPRLFAQGTYAFNFDRRVIVDKGLKPADFDSNFGDADVRVELEGESRFSWFVGGGVAVQMPTQRPFFLKVGGAYSEDAVDIRASIERGFEVDNELFLRRSAVKKSFTVPGVGPSFGLETEVLRMGPMALFFSLDLFVTFPLGSAQERFGVEQDFGNGATPGDGSLEVCPANSINSVNPGGGPQGQDIACLEAVQITWDADDIHYHGAAMLRFTWLGR